MANNSDRPSPGGRGPAPRPSAQDPRPGGPTAAAGGEPIPPGGLRPSSSARPRPAARPAAKPAAGGKMWSPAEKLVDQAPEPAGPPPGQDLRMVPLVEEESDAELGAPGGGRGPRHHRLG